MSDNYQLINRITAKEFVMPLPSNDALTAYSADVSWQEVENIRRHFTRALETITTTASDDILPLDALSEAVGTPVTTYYDAVQPDTGNVLLTEIKGHPLVLGSYVSKRYRSGHSLLESVVPYNLNPSVNHSNIEETEDSLTRLRVLGAEIELGLVHPDGHSPDRRRSAGLYHGLCQPRAAARRLSPP